MAFILPTCLGIPSPKSPSICEAGESRSSESAGNTLGSPSEKAAEAAAVTEFDLTAEQRRRLVVQEQ
jgi:hypothetical protein